MPSYTGPPNPFSADDPQLRRCANLIGLSPIVFAAQLNAGTAPAETLRGIIRAEFTTPYDLQPLSQAQLHNLAYWLFTRKAGSATGFPFPTDLTNTGPAS